MRFIKYLMRIIPDKPYICLQYYHHFHKLPCLKKPKSFNEKLQWLKLYDRKPLYVTMVDKVLAKDYVGNIIGFEHIIPTLGVWNNVEDIDFDKLPNKFVLKTNHDSKGVVVCPDKDKLNIEDTKSFLKKQLKSNGYWYGREWPYKKVEKKILAEQYLEDPTGDLVDYKLMCFDGKVKCSFVCSDRFTGKGLHVTFFDRDWNVMPFERSYPHLENGLPKPSRYEDMIMYAEQIAKGLRFARIDFYEYNNQVYFGEITLYPGSGLESFQPESWDIKIGKWLSI